MIDSINIKAVLAAVVQKKIPLSAHLLIKVTDPLASTYQILDLLCDYFNSIQTIEHRKEMETLTFLKQEKKLYQEKYNDLLIRYNETVKELLDTKDSELNERKQSQNLSDKVREQKSKIESLNSELERLKLFQ